MRAATFFTYAYYHSQFACEQLTEKYFSLVDRTMTNSLFDDPQFNQAVFASVIVVLILLRWKQQSNNSALFCQRLNNFVVR